MKTRARNLALVAMGALIITAASVATLRAAEQSDRDSFLEKVERWQDEMSDRFRDTWRSLRRDRGGDSTGSSASVDLREQNNSYTVRLNLPNRDLDTVEITLVDGKLSIVAPTGRAGRYEQTVILTGVASDAEPRIERKKEDDLIIVTVPKKAGDADSATRQHGGSLLSPLSEWESDVVKRMEEMRREMDRVFDESFREFQLTPEYKGMFDLRTFGSFVDLKDEGMVYRVTAYLPDRNLDDVNVTLDEQKLKIEAKASAAAAPAGNREKEAEVSRMAHYSQLLTLPGPVQANQMKVEKKEGVLIVTFPKAE